MTENHDLSEANPRAHTATGGSTIPRVGVARKNTYAILINV